MVQSLTRIIFYAYKRLTTSPTSGLAAARRWWPRLLSRRLGCGSSPSSRRKAAAARRRWPSIWPWRPRRPGQAALILDLDPQGSAEAWYQDREADTPRLARATAAELGRAIEMARGQGFSHVLLDTPGRDEPAVAAAIRAAGFLRRAVPADAGRHEGDTGDRRHHPPPRQAGRLRADPDPAARLPHPRGAHRAGRAGHGGPGRRGVAQRLPGCAWRAGSGSPSTSPRARRRRRSASCGAGSRARWRSWRHDPQAHVARRHSGAAEPPSRRSAAGCRSRRACRAGRR